MAGKDTRIWGKFDVDMPDNPKVMPLSDAAFRCLIEATLWSRKQLLDGFVPNRYAVARWSLDALQELCSNDVDRPSLFEVEGGYQIRDFALHQQTKAEVETRRQQAKVAGQKGGLAQRKRTAKRVASKTPSGIEAEKEEEKEKDSSSSSPSVTRETGR